MPDQTLATTSLRPLLRATLFEATTLLMLVGIAVPMKHLGGYPQAVAWMGPVHGIAFLLYLWTTLQVAAAQGWGYGRVAWLILGACLPLGGFFMVRAMLRDATQHGSA